LRRALSLVDVGHAVASTRTSIAESSLAKTAHSRAAAAPIAVQTPAIARMPTRWLTSAVISALMLLLIGLGLYPAPLVSLIRTTAVALARVQHPASLFMHRSCQLAKAA
jgi:hypothetical protein